MFLGQSRRQSPYQLPQRSWMLYPIHHFSFIYVILTSLDQKDPIIKDDKEYPDWVHSLHIKGADKLALLNKLNTNEKEMTMDEARRLKRLLTLDDIREANALKGAAKSGN